MFTVGVGEEKMARDIQVSRVETPRQALKGSFLVVDVVITQTGFEGQTLPLVVESEGRVVDTQDIPMPDDGSGDVRVSSRWTKSACGVSSSASPNKRRAGAANNARENVIAVIDRASAAVLEATALRCEVINMRSKRARIRWRCAAHRRGTHRRREFSAWASTPD